MLYLIYLICRLTQRVCFDQIVFAVEGKIVLKKYLGLFFFMGVLTSGSLIAIGPEGYDFLHQTLMKLEGFDYLKRLKEEHNAFPTALCEKLPQDYDFSYPLEQMWSANSLYMAALYLDEEFAQAVFPEAAETFARAREHVSLPKLLYFLKRCSSVLKLTGLGCHLYGPKVFGNKEILERSLDSLCIFFNFLDDIALTHPEQTKNFILGNGVHNFLCSRVSMAILADIIILVGLEPESCSDTDM